MAVLSPKIECYVYLPLRTHKTLFRHKTVFDPEKVYLSPHDAAYQLQIQNVLNNHPDLIHAESELNMLKVIIVYEVFCV